MMPIVIGHVFLVAVVAGLHVGSALYFNPAIDALPLRAQLETQRQVNLRFNPTIAWLMVGMTLSGRPVLAIVRATSVEVALFGSALGCLVVTIVTTVSINVPINKRVMTEPLDAIESEWPAMRAMEPLQSTADRSADGRARARAGGASSLRRVPLETRRARSRRGAACRGRDRTA